MSNRATFAKVARSEGVRQVLDELGDWAAGSGPVFRVLARALASAIERGALPRGTRLPAERALALAVAVSRGTAVAAYDVLVADGLVQRRPGSGTFVLGPESLELPSGREGSALVHRLVDRSAGSTDVVDLSLSVLDDATGLPPLRLTTADLAAVEPTTGYLPWGLAGLRRALADLVTSWGLPTTAAQIVVTTGAQQAISAAAACWVRPGDVVVVEDPTYPGAMPAFGQAGAEVVGVPVDHHGIKVDDLAAVLRDRRPALVYVQPTVHSPTGAVLADARRRRIAALVADHRVPLVEDHALAGLAWRAPPPPIAAYAPGASIAVVGSLSKRYWGGLRVGFVRAPEALALRMARVKATHDLGSSAVSQVVAERLLRSGAADRLLRSRVADLHARYSTLAGALRRELPTWAWAPPAGGLSIWVQLPRPVAGELAQVALRHGVAVATAAALSPDPPADRLRLSFAAPAATITAGVRRLALAWKTVAG